MFFPLSLYLSLSLSLFSILLFSSFHVLSRFSPSSFILPFQASIVANLKGLRYKLDIHTRPSTTHFFHPSRPPTSHRRRARSIQTLHLGPFSLLVRSRRNQPNSHQLLFQSWPFLIQQKWQTQSQ